jgi:hypothetical protein
LTRRTTAVCLAALVGAAAACGGGGSGERATTTMAPGPTSSPAATGPTATLDASHPTARLSAAVPAHPGLVELRVEGVANPAQSPLTVTVSVPGAGPVGVVGVYPPGQPGTYRLALPAHTAAALAGKAETSVEITLGTQRGASLAGVRVTVGLPRVLAESG